MLTAYLKKIPLFKHLKDSQLKELASRCRDVAFRKGQTIFRKTDMSTDLYVVVSGRVKAILEDDEGDEILLAKFEKGDFFGEMSLLDGKGRSATIVVDEDASCSVLSKDAFLDSLMQDPRISVSLMSTLAERLRKADDMIESLAFQDVVERLLRALLEMANPSSLDAEGFLKVQKITHRELAGRIGSSREAVSKGLKTLVNRKVLREGENCILVAKDALQRYRMPGKAS